MWKTTTGTKKNRTEKVRLHFAEKYMQNIIVHNFPFRVHILRATSSRQLTSTIRKQNISRVYDANVCHVPGLSCKISKTCSSETGLQRRFKSVVKLTCVYLGLDHEHSYLSTEFSKPLTEYPGILQGWGGNLRCKKHTNICLHSCCTCFYCWCELWRQEKHLSCLDPAWEIKVFTSQQDNSLTGQVNHPPWSWISMDFTYRRQE